MPRKKVKGSKKRPAAKQTNTFQPEANNTESSLKLKNWLDEVCQNIDNYDMSEIPEIDETEIDMDENECNLKELEV